MKQNKSHTDLIDTRIYLNIRVKRQFHLLKIPFINDIESLVVLWKQLY